MGIFKTIKDWFTMETVHWSGGSKLPPPTKEKKVETRYIAVYRPMRKTSEDGRREKIDILLHVDLELDTKAENVNISMEGLEHVNVCLASFLTKGVSYAQEKYNEYKQSPKSEAEFGMSESTKTMLKELAHKEAKKGGKR